jgi:four helix bundle protein
MKTHKDLLVWQKAMDFVIDVYNATKSFPANELYGLTNQIRRSAVSIPSNIAEGAARQTDKEFLQFLHIARGSLAELETQLILAGRLNYTETVPVDKLEEIRKMLSGLINNIRTRKN